MCIASLSLAGEFSFRAAKSHFIFLLLSMCLVVASLHSIHHNYLLFTGLVEGRRQQQSKYYYFSSLKKRSGLQQKNVDFCKKKKIAMSKIENAPLSAYCLLRIVEF